MTQTPLLLALCILITVTANLFVKKGILILGNLELSFSNFLGLIPRVLQNVWLMAGLFLSGTAFLLWLFLVSKLQLNIAYPIVVSLNLCFIVIASWFLFKEYLSLFQVLGIVIVIIGVLVVSQKGPM
ncbi:MAG: EamA family transporter [Candidatus Nealsonbacteria bacterium]